jgi:hypothetical protein
MNVATLPQSTGDWSIRGRDADQVFASQQLSDTAMTAAVRVSARFDASFPGWYLYRRVVAGVGLFDRQLEAWAVTNARMLSRMSKRTPSGQIRSYIGEATRGKPGWIAQAGRDALDFAIYKRYAAGLNERGERFGVHWKTYQSIRDPVAAGMCIGLETFASEIHAEYFRVRWEEKRAA